MTFEEAYALKSDAQTCHGELSKELAEWTARLERANERAAAGLDPDDNPEQDACVEVIERLRADIAEAEDQISDANDVIIARQTKPSDDAEEDAEPTVSVPVSALRALRDNWEGGDLAGAVNDLLAYLDDEAEEGAGE